MLLRGKQAKDAKAALGALSRALGSKATARIANPSLAGGQAGLAVAHVALAPLFPAGKHAQHAAAALDASVAALASTRMAPALYGGFAGVAWVAELLHGDASTPADEDLNTGIDEALAGWLAHSPWVEPYDVVEGLVGLGVYALERMPRASAKGLVALVVDRLAETAEKQKPGVAWRTRPEWNPPEVAPEPADAFPTWNLGVAHGVPGVIAFLGAVCAAGVGKSTERKAHALLEKTVAWTLAQELPRGPGGRFAHVCGDGVARTPARAAWCYGDPGIAIALLVAGRGAGERAWTKTGTRIALDAAKRPADDTGVMDASLCHGAAGLAHIFHRAHRMTGDPRLADAARAWFKRTLAMRKPRGGFAGWVSWSPRPRGGMGWVADASFLTGGAGIALALAAAVTDDDPGWDRALLLSARIPRTPPRPVNRR